MSARRVDYAKLTDDVRAARAAAEAAAGTDDAGSCNLDVATLRVPGAPAAKVLAALAAGGLRASKSTPGYTLAAPSWGQAARNTRQVEALARTLRERGWDASVRYRAD